MKDHYTEPVKRWFGKDWKSQIDWSKDAPKRATRTSEDGDNLNLKPISNWGSTQRKSRG